MGRYKKWALAALVLVATALRFRAFFGNSFHADEALFGSWARLIAVWRDPLLQTQMVDKPPLLFYLQAAFYPVLGTTAPWVARLPAFIASLLLVPLSARLGWRLYREEAVAVVAAAFVALSPMTIQFAATAFTDPLLTLWFVAALTMISFRPSAAHSWWAGVFSGLAIATKHQAWLVLPLIVGLGLVRGWRKPDWWRWLAGFLPIVVALLLWDVARTGTLSLWGDQIANVGGLRFAWSWELWPRLEAWAKWWGILLGSPLLAFLVILGLPAFLALIIYYQDWPTAHDQLLLLFLLGFGAIHWFVAVPVWDRYLLPVVPLVGLMLGRFISRVASFVAPEIPARQPKRLVTLLMGSVLVVSLLPSAWQARQGTFATGGRPDADRGAEEVAAALNGAPYGVVLYDHWYSWHWRYHLFDSGAYVSWFPHPAALLEDLNAFGGDGAQRYLALPDGLQAAPVARAVRQAGFVLEPVSAAGEIVLFRIDR